MKQRDNYKQPSTHGRYSCTSSLVRLRMKRASRLCSLVMMRLRCSSPMTCVLAARVSGRTMLQAERKQGYEHNEWWWKMYAIINNQRQTSARGHIHLKRRVLLRATHLYTLWKLSLELNTCGMVKFISAHSSISVFCGGEGNVKKS